MHRKIESDFNALSARAKIAVLARTIHMETIYNRDYPEAAERLYRSSEFVHRLAGAIMSLTYEPENFSERTTWFTNVLVEGVAARGQSQLTKFHEWIDEVRSMPSD